MWSHETGFTSLRYAFALFDIQKAERVIGMNAGGIHVLGILQNDDEIKNDPSLAAKIVLRKEDNSASGNSSTVTVNLSDEQVFYFVFKTLRRGESPISRKTPRSGKTTSQ
jgi:hypothetical protein